MSKEKTNVTVDDQITDGGIDRIRQILFGEQIAEIERRFARLEERLAEESIQLRRDFTQRLDALATQLRAEINSISAGLEDDSKQRAELSDLFANISLSLKGRPKDQDLG